MSIGYNLGYECAKNDPQIGKFADFDCYDGCLYAEWIEHGYKALDEPSDLYDQCTNVCLQGEQYFEVNKTESKRI